MGPNEGPYLNALRHDCRMSDVPDAPATPEIQPGVMSSLPKTRPQRPSARRASGRKATAARASAAGKTRSSTPADGAPTTSSRSAPSDKATRKTSAKTASKAHPRKASTTAGSRTNNRPRKPAAEPLRAPRQGFEAESEIETGAPVAPPNGVELAASVVELLGELAQSGLRSGERLLRDALLRRPSG